MWAGGAEWGTCYGTIDRLLSSKDKQEGVSGGDDRGCGETSRLAGERIWEKRDSGGALTSDLRLATEHRVPLSCEQGAT